MTNVSSELMAHACETYVDQLRRLRRAVITDPSVDTGKRRLQAGLASLRECASTVIAGLTKSEDMLDAAVDVMSHSMRLREDQGLESIKPLVRVGFDQCGKHLEGLDKSYAHGGDASATDYLVRSKFSGEFQPFVFSTLTSHLQTPDTVAVAPLSYDAFLLALLEGFNRRMEKCLPFTIGIAATNPYPEDNLFDVAESRCLLPEPVPAHCVILTDINVKNVTRRECERVILAMHPVIKVLE